MKRMMSEPPNNYTLSLTGMSQIGQVDDPAEDPLGVTGSKSNSCHSDNSPKNGFINRSSSIAKQADMMKSYSITPEFGVEGLGHFDAIVMVGDEGQEKTDLVQQLT